MPYETNYCVRKFRLVAAVSPPSRSTIFPKLHELNALSSYSHCGRYYTLHTSTRFDAHGLWIHCETRFRHTAPCAPPWPRWDLRVARRGRGRTRRAVLERSLNVVRRARSGSLRLVYLDEQDRCENCDT